MSYSKIASSMLALAAAHAACADGTWENVVVADGLTIGNVPGYPNAVFVPNSFSNPLIGADGTVYFKAQCAGGPTSGPNGGPWIGTGGTSTAPQNSRVFVAFGSSGSSIIGRDSGPLPGGLLPGYQLNSYLWATGVTSSNPFMNAGNGYVWTVNVNTTSGTATTSANQARILYHGGDGTDAVLYSPGMAYPPASGVTFTTSFGSPTYMNSNGQAALYATLAGTGVVTSGAAANNNAWILLGPAGVTQLVRKGDAAPGFSDGTTVTPDSFGGQMCGSNVLISAKLANGPAGSVTTSNDSIYLTTAGSAPGTVRIIARKGSEFPGLSGLTAVNSVTPTSSPFTPIGRPVASDGSIYMLNRTSGIYPDSTPVTSNLNDYALMKEFNGSWSVLLHGGHPRR
jgi:hypothetical protein